MKKRRKPGVKEVTLNYDEPRYSWISYMNIGLRTQNTHWRTILIRRRRTWTSERRNPWWGCFWYGWEENGRCVKTRDVTRKPCHVPCHCAMKSMGRTTRTMDVLCFFFEKKNFPSETNFFNKKVFSLKKQKRKGSNEKTKNVKTVNKNEGRKHHM